MITSAAGTAVGRHHYYPYGSEARISNPGVDEPLAKFTGHQRDPAGRTDYMLGRTCVFPMMRFSSVDPARDGWNLYAYVGGNPINVVDPTGEAGAQIADYLDAQIEQFKQQATQGVTNGGVSGIIAATGIGTLADAAKLLTDTLRLGQGIGTAVADPNVSAGEAALLVLQDVGRGATVAGGLGAAGGKIASGFGKASKLKEVRGGGRFLPDEYYDAKLRQRAPGQASPYAQYERFDADGNLKQVTIYDKFGDRVRQYDLGPSARHGEGSHSFDYSSARPRQAPGGGLRSPHRPFGQEN